MTSKISTPVSWLLCLSLAWTLSLIGQPAGRRRAAAPAGTIQQLYMTLASVSISEEKVLFRTLTPTVRASLWSYHLSLFFRDHPNLSVEQLAVVTEALAMAGDPHFFEITPASPEWNWKHARLETLSSKGKAVFSPELFRAAFLKLGPAEAGFHLNDDPAETAPDNSETFTGANDTIRRQLTAFPCECYSATWDCGIGHSTCFYNGFTCYEHVGCGFWHEDTCDGLCS